MPHPAAPSGFSARQLAVGLAGYCAFINLYSPQAVLPLLSQEFGVTAAEVAAVMTAGTLSVALIAPFAGMVSDVLGRKRVIVTAMLILTIPTIMAAMAPTLHQLIVWRFIQGLVLPPIFAVTVAYIGEEWPAHEATRATGIYTSGASLGGFSGRFITGVIADFAGWRIGMVVLAVMTLAGAALVAKLLPREKRFVRSSGALEATKQMLTHFRNPQLLATYAVGFGVLFNFIGTFTYISFQLAGDPFNLSPSWLGIIFTTYLAGAALAPLAGRAVARFGRKWFMIDVLVVWLGGILLTLIPSLVAIIAGLAVCAACGLMSQAISTGYVTLSAKVGRSSAVGLYVSSFYVGGSFGALFGGIAWTFGGWGACAMMVSAMLMIMILIIATFWSAKAPAAPSAPVEPI